MSRLAPPALAGLGQPVVTRRGAIDGKKVELQLYQVVRDGAVSHLNFTLTGDRVQIADALADGNYDAIDRDGRTADGITLVDGKNAKLYLVASDGDGHCLCSRDLSAVLLGEEPTLVSATFANPPADVTTVDVRVPSFGSLPRVPVQ